MNLKVDVSSFKNQVLHKLYSTAIAINTMTSQGNHMNEEISLKNTKQHTQLF